jgi:hypothetical protein
MTTETLDIVYDISDEVVLEDRNILAVLVDNELVLGLEEPARVLDKNRV